MAYLEQVRSISLLAGADLRTHQFKFVSVAADGDVELTGDDATADFVLLNAPNSGEAAELALPGSVVKVACGAAVTRGGDVGSGANGAAKNTDTGSAINGVALETGANGRVITILFHPR